MLVEPSFADLLNHMRKGIDTQEMNFVKHFSGEKTKAKLNELNTVFSYFALRVKKRRPRKKHKGKVSEISFEYGSLSAMLKYILICFKSCDKIHMLHDFNKNDGFTAIIKIK